MERSGVAREPRLSRRWNPELLVLLLLGVAPAPGVALLPLFAAPLAPLRGALLAPLLAELTPPS